MAGQRVKLSLPGFIPLKGSKARRYINPTTHENISLREFQRRASRQSYTPPPVKPRETAREHRLKLYQNYVNRQVWLEGGQPWEYKSKEEISRYPEFNYYDNLVHSGYEDDRDYARDFWDDLEDIYANQDWGETP